MVSGLIKSLFRRPRVDRRTLIVGLALVAIFSSALTMRMYPAQYGFYLNEFDPFFDYYATDFIVDQYDQNGLFGVGKYFTWTDNRTWYPEGRQVANTSQVGLQLAGAGMYIVARDVFGAQISLYDFVVLFPVYFGALTAIVSFLLIRRIGGTSAGLLGSLIIAFSPPLIIRGNLGWFKSEPFALFLSISALFLLLKALDSKTDGKRQVIFGILVGVLLGYANASWGGSQFFSIIIALSFFALPFLRADLSRIIPSAGSIISLTLLVSSISPRPGISFVTSPVGLLLLGSMIFLLAANYVQSRVEVKQYMPSLFKILLSFGLLAALLLGLGFTSDVSGRYMTVVYPFQRSGIPLVESVAEHFVPTGVEYLASYWIFAFLGTFGAYLLFRRRGFNSVFVLILGLLSIYVASSFTRLLVFTSLSFAILGGIGFAEITSSFLKSTSSRAGRPKIRLGGQRAEVKFMYAIFMLLLLAAPLILPLPGNWVASANTPVSIVNAGTATTLSMPDWFEALDWMRTNTKENSVIAAWWDYGYWITVMGDRISLADNATINSTRIALLGEMYLSNQTKSLSILKSMGADYVVVFVAGQRLEVQGYPQYVLGAGGDESKMQWFMRISGLPVDQFLHADNTPKPFFWENTFLGKLFPFTLTQYIDQKGQLAGTEYKEGYIPLYSYDMKFPSESDGPVRLAFESSSLKKNESGLLAGVLIYEIVT